MLPFGYRWYGRPTVITLSPSVFSCIYRNSFICLCWCLSLDELVWMSARNGSRVLTTTWRRSCNEILWPTMKSSWSCIVKSLCSTCLFFYFSQFLEFLHYKYIISITITISVPLILFFFKRFWFFGLCVRLNW